MKSFQVGDHVVVYTPQEDPLMKGRTTGKVLEVKRHCLIVVDDHKVQHYYVHPKQCRKLKTTQLKRVYFLKDDEGAFESNSHLIMNALQPGEKIEFIEVRKKK